jgi:putative transposase
MGPSGCTTAGTANPAADMHDEWQSGERRYLSEGSMAPCKPTSDTGSIAAIDSGE